MAYRKPFTPSQRQEAVRAYRSYRKHRSLMRRRYPALDEAQTRVLEQYDVALRTLVEILKRPDRKINVDALNRADALARWAAMEYWRLRS